MNTYEKMAASPELVSRFWRKVAMGKPEDCWLWMGQIDKDGYGFIRPMFDGVKRRVGAHRLSCTLAHGPVGDGRVVRHSCDTPACVNPAHLVSGTYSENTKDSVVRGRHRCLKGENHNFAKLDNRKVIEIRSRADLSCAHFSRLYGVSRTTVREIRKGNTWRHIL